MLKDWVELAADLELGGGAGNCGERLLFVCDAGAGLDGRTGAGAAGDGSGCTERGGFGFCRAVVCGGRGAEAGFVTGGAGAGSGGLGDGLFEPTMRLNC